MMGKTHALAGATVGLSVGVTAGDAPGALALAVIGAIIALIPDIDHGQSTMSRALGPVGAIVSSALPHRGPTHTGIVWAIITATAFYWLPWPLPSTISLAYLSHLVLDALTVDGAPLLWPVNRIRGPLHTNGVSEWIIYLGLIGAICLYLIYLVMGMGL